MEGVIRPGYCPPLTRTMQPRQVPSVPPRRPLRIGCTRTLPRSRPRGGVQPERACILIWIPSRLQSCARNTDGGASRTFPAIAIRRSIAIGATRPGAVVRDHGRPLTPSSSSPPPPPPPLRRSGKANTLVRRAFSHACAATTREDVVVDALPPPPPSSRSSSSRIRRRCPRCDDSSVQVGDGTEVQQEGMAPSDPRTTMGRRSTGGGADPRSRQEVSGGRGN